MKQLLFMLIAILSTIQTQSQTHGNTQIIGRVYDSSIATFLSGASIICLNSADSTKVRLTLTSKDGSFVIDSLIPGSYLITVTYIGYKNFSHLIKVENSVHSINMGVTPLQRIGLNLAVIEVKEAKNQVRIKRDTIEYNASNFKTRPNATVDELLKKLPGVEVADDGSITINGEIVKQILIDGRLFFVDDHKLVSRYLLSEMVDKIQLIDRKKNQNQSNEINGSRTEKVINLTIRKDRRNEITGQISSSYGASSKFASKINLSRFREKQQISVFGTGDNVNGFQDGNINTNDGVIRSWKSGIDYSEDLSRKVTLSSSYLIDNTLGQYQKKSTQQNFLLDSNYYTQQSKSTDHSANQIVNIKLDYKIDSFQILSFTNRSGYQSISDIRNDSFIMIDNQTKILNNGFVKNSSNRNRYNMMNDILFVKKFKNEGRLLNIDLSYEINNQKGTAYNLSRSEYSQYNTETRIDTINQRRTSLNKNKSAQLLITYIEPIIKTHSLTFTYLFTHEKKTSNSPVYDYDVHTGDYSHLNDTFSNTFLSKSFYHYLGLGISTSQKRYDYNVIFNAFVADVYNNNLSKSSSMELQSTSILPNLSFNYYFSQSKRLNISYLATVEIPDVSQLQPFVDNSNPVYIKLGNPDLKPTHIHSASINYNSVNTKSLRNVSIRLSGDYIAKKIINGTSVDTLGRQSSQPINKDGAFALRMVVDNSYPVRKGSTIKFSTVLWLNRDVNYLNGRDGSSQNISGMQSITFRSSYKSLFDIFTSASVSYNNLKYTNSESNNTNFFAYKFSLDWNANTLLGIVVGGSIRYMINTGMAAGYNANTFVMNAYISKPLLRTKQLVVKMQGFDLLNRNTNNTRIISDSYITDTYSIGLKRVFLFNLTYYIKKNRIVNK